MFHPEHSTLAAAGVRGVRSLITESIKEVSPLLPNPCHHQDYERSIFPPDPYGSEGCPPKICADEVGAPPSPFFNNV